MMRRSFVMLSVFIIVTLALLVVTGILYMTQAESAARHRAIARTTNRALGWSAANVLMNELNAQRPAILDGRLPELEQQYELYDSDTGLAVVRLLAIGDSESLLQPESARLDINEIDAKILAATNVVDSALAEAIIDHRDRQFNGTFRSLADLAGVPGIDPQLVFGPPSRFDIMRRAQQSISEGPSRGAASSDDMPPEALADAVTVYGFEPAIQRNEKQRINLDVPWSDELGERVNERFGDGASAVLRQLFEQIEFNADSKIVETMIRFDTELETWIDVLDVLTTDPDAYHFGRVNINTASSEVLAALPGIEPEQAAQLVQMRDGLDDDDRATIVWPLLHDILPRESYVELAGLLTTRSWTYRLHLAAGTVNPDNPEGPLTDPQIFEIVIDLAAPQPRIAYFRDITMLQSAIMLASDATGRGMGLGDESDDDVDEPDDLTTNSDDDAPPTADAGDSTSRTPPLTRPPSMSNPTDRSNSDDGAQAEPPPGRRRPGRWHSGS